MEWEKPADGVLSYHLSTLTCGVAKFNRVLAGHLGVPLLHVLDPAAKQLARPLLSVKVAEFDDADLAGLDRFVRELRPPQSLRLFLHTYGDSAIEERLVRRADVVWCANREIVVQLHDIRPDAIEAWCPGSLFDAHRFAKPEISVFTFGMAHKMRLRHYERLRHLLEATGRSYCIYLSTALHDGTTFEESFTAAFAELRDLFDGHVYFLGFLSDTAIYNYLSDATFVAAFFDRGVRANNTSIHTAMQCGAVVITNLDASSPETFAHMESVIDVERSASLPLEPATLARIGGRARDVARMLGWEELVRHLEASVGGDRRALTA